MRIDVTEVSKSSGSALPLTSTSFSSGEVTLVPEETQLRPTVLGLIASGRMRPDTGAVTIDGDPDTAALRRRVALVDAPQVSEPALGVTLATVVAEELMFAGRAAGPGAVNAELHLLGALSWARTPIETVPATTRIRVLIELALLRHEVDAIVLTAPDRHGGDPLDWWRICRDVAAHGIAVLVIAGLASAAAIAAEELLIRLDETESR
jgi:hypothetical protein